MVFGYREARKAGLFERGGPSLICTACNLLSAIKIPENTHNVFFDVPLLGFTSRVALITLGLGIMTTGMGPIGIYLGKVFTQVQNRAIYIVKDVHR